MSVVHEVNSMIEESLNESGYVCNSSNVWKYMSNVAEKCYVPCLSSPYDEMNKPSEEEYKIYTNKYLDHLNTLENMLSALENRQLEYPLNPDFASSIIVLAEQMKAKGPWSVLFENKSSENIIGWLNEHNNIYESSDTGFKDNVFGLCMKNLHHFLTQQKWKHYPALVEAYRSIIKNMTKTGKVTCPLHLAFPAALIQMDDFHVETRLDGLKCCHILLKNLNYEITGYEDAVYEYLMKLLLHKETVLLEELLECLLLILPIYISEDPLEWTKCDDVFEAVLDNVYMESDFIRKNIYLRFLPSLINLSTSSAIRWKKTILNMLSDGVDIYLNSSFNHECVNNCVDCLLAWIRVGWPVWSHSTDHIVLVRLFKLLYLCCDNEDIGKNVEMKNIEKSILTILSLYSESERIDVFDQSEISVSALGPRFEAVWTEIRDTVLAHEESDDSLDYDLCDEIGSLEISSCE